MEQKWNEYLGICMNFAFNKSNMKTTQSKIALPAWAAPGKQERAWRVKSKQRIPRTVR